MSEFIYFGQFRFPRAIAEQHEEPPRLFVPSYMNRSYTREYAFDEDVIYFSFYSSFGKYLTEDNKEKIGWHPMVSQDTKPDQFPDCKMVWDKCRQSYNLVDPEGVVLMYGVDHTAYEMRQWIIYYGLKKYVTPVTNFEPMGNYEGDMELFGANYQGKNSPDSNIFF